MAKFENIQCLRITHFDELWFWGAYHMFILYKKLLLTLQLEIYISFNSYDYLPHHKRTKRVGK